MDRRDVSTNDLIEEEEDIHEEDEEEYSPNLVDNHKTNTKNSTESAITTQTQ